MLTYLILDILAVREFLKDGHQILLCQSFAKNFGLYGKCFIRKESREITKVSHGFNRNNK
tara:strand:+ start:339 stop:518 length:180 start_codon:yes stop_codon:yes gene_type:complete